MIAQEIYKTLVNSLKTLFVIELISIFFRESNLGEAILFILNSVV